MTRYVALLRAVNVGGTGKLAMNDLRKLCEDAGFGNVRTYIASGNVVFDSDATESKVKKTLESKLNALTGKPCDVLVRSAAELAEVLVANPFRSEAPNRTVAIFLDEHPPADTLELVTGRRSEQMALGKREIYVFYGDGMADSKLKIRAAKDGTARNMNTIAKLVELANKT